MRPSAIMLLGFVGILAGGVGGPRAADPPKKLPPPTVPEQQRAIRMAQDRYASNELELATAERRIALAQRLLEIDRTSDNDAMGRYGLLAVAIQQAALGGDAQLTFRVIDALNAEYELDTSGMRVDALAMLARSVRDPEQRQFMISRALESLDMAIAADRHDLTYSLSLALQAQGKLLIGAELRMLVRARAAEAADAKTARTRYEAAEQQLARQPDDPTAHAIVGRYECLIRGRWDVGLPHLARGDDEALRQIAERESSRPSTAEAQYSLAQAWWEASQREAVRSKRLALIRAGIWYEKAVAGLSGAPLDLARERLREIAPQATSDVPKLNALFKPAGDRDASK